MKTCLGCACPIPESLGTKPRKWCSGACRTRTIYHESASYRKRQSELAARRHRESYVPTSHDLVCQQCGAEFKNKMRHAMYCTPLCKNRALSAARKADGRLKEQRIKGAERIREYAIKYMATYRQSETGLQAIQAGSDRRRALLNGCETERFTHVEIFDRDGWICGLCHKPVDPDLAYPDPMSKSLDHVVALTRGGGHLRSNTQLAHLVCNVSKGNRAA